MAAGSTSTWLDLRWRKALPSLRLGRSSGVAVVVVVVVVVEVVVVLVVEAGEKLRWFEILMP